MRNSSYIEYILVEQKLKNWDLSLIKITKKNYNKISKQ